MRSRIGLRLVVVEFLAVVAAATAQPGAAERPAAKAQTDSAVPTPVSVIAIPLSVFGDKSTKFAVDGKPAALAEGSILLPKGIPSAVTWSEGDAARSATLTAVDRSCSNAAPNWAETASVGAVAGFGGSTTLAFARDKAMTKARAALMRAAMGGGGGVVRGTMSGSRARDVVMTVARDAADQPPYTPTASRMPMADKAATDGTPGAPWVRCWALVTGGTVEPDPPSNGK